MIPPYLEFQTHLRLTNPELVSLLVRIEAYKIAVSKIPLPPGLRRKINRLNILRSIRGTTGIEGNQLDAQQIEKVLNKRKIRSVEEQEVLNSSRVHEYIRAQDRKQNSSTISEDLIKEIHRITIEDCDYPNTSPGIYRTTNVTAGEFHPPNHEEIPELMKIFIEFINSRELAEAYRPVICFILAHFYVVTIHPFADGNGRTSRALEAYILYQGGYNIRGFYSLANFYYRNRGKYIQMLQDARFKYNGDLNEFVLFSLRGFLEELESAENEMHDFLRIVLFKDYIREIISSPKLAKNNSSRGRIFSLINWLVDEYPEGRELKLIRERSDEFISRLYRSTNSVRTIDRDIQALMRNRLVLVQQNITLEPKLIPNLQLMQEFES